jgi:transcriptional regulator with XRE-family HTH domain
MNFADRLKSMRAEKGITQVQLAEAMSVSKGTIAMWETQKREPNFDRLCELSEYFDRRIDYILGHSDDKSTIHMTQEEMNSLGAADAEDYFFEMAMMYLCLDDYGKRAVEDLIRSETQRCRDQKTLLPENAFKVSIRIRDEEDND